MNLYVKNSWIYKNRIQSDYDSYLKRILVIFIMYSNINKLFHICLIDSIDYRLSTIDLITAKIAVDNFLDPIYSINIFMKKTFYDKAKSILFVFFM